MKQRRRRFFTNSELDLASEYKRWSSYSDPILVAMVNARWTIVEKPTVSIDLYKPVSQSPGSIRK